ncbi:MAG: Ig-like domain-containing protein [Flavobacterium micromati]|nr:Ig-like domain-containing protein [Flavobacterium micromati]
MLKNNFKYTIFIFLFIIFSCAKRGSITGGLKDTIAPVLKISFPENFKTNFTGNQIKLVFDENIKLKDLNKQLIVSPPMKTEPTVLPTTVSKTITIKIKDTLQPNTTYSFNFGQSIADNNEGNPYSQFKYVFSTGNFIDSLSLNGTIKSAYDKEVESFVSVMLYEVNENFTDSIVYKETPRYITNTLDSLKSFRLENLKAGKYLLVALKDLNNNNKYNPKTDKIGFYRDFVTIPTDATPELSLFKEEIPFKAFKPVQASGNRLFLGYEGVVNANATKPQITLKDNDVMLLSLATKVPQKDSLQIWYKPIKADSLNLAVAKEKYSNNFTFKIKNQKKDTLAISAIQSNELKFTDRFTLESTTPLIAIDNSKINIVNNAKIKVSFTTEYDEFNQRIFFDFQKEPSENYNFSLLPGALNDYYGKSNDTLKYKVSTKNTSDYGNLTVVLQNIKQFPVIIELTDSKGDVVATEYTEESTTINFNLIDPALYTLRAIYDSNKNKLWDPGNYLEKRQPEEVIYFSKELDVRANWDVNQTFDLSLPYIPEIKKKAVKKK